MDLGLGVLEEKPAKKGKGTIRIKREIDGSDTGEEKEGDVLGRLMGKREKEGRPRKKVKIEVL